MAIRTFNSVGGFSVGEIPTNVIDSSGVGSFTSIKTDALLRADGTVWDLQQAAGQTGWIQFNTNDNFDATANLIFDIGTYDASSNPTGTLDTLTVGGNIISTNVVAANIDAGNIALSGDFSAEGNVNIGGNIDITGDMNVANIDAGNIALSGDFTSAGNVNIGGNVDITGDMNVGNIIGNLSGNVSGNFTGNFSGSITGDVSFSAPGNISEMLFTDAKFDENGVQMFYGNGDPMTSLSASAGIRYIKVSNNLEIDGNIVLNNTDISNVKNINFETGGQILDSTGNVVIKSGASEWTFNSDGDLIAPGNITGVDALSVQSLSVAGVVSLTGSTSVGGDLEVGGDATITGTLIADVVETADLSVSGFVTSNLLPYPGADGIGGGIDLGSETHPWRDLWLSGNSIKLGNATISATGTGSNVVTMTNQTITGTLNVGNVDTTGYITLGNATSYTNANLTVYGVSKIVNTATTTDATTGALVVAGGVGIGGNIYVTGKSNLVGDVAVSGNASVTGNLAITGDLIVSGTTTYVNTTNTSISDAIIDLGGAGSGADNSGSVVGDRGLLLHGSSAVNQFVGWNTGNAEFQMLATTTITDGATAGTLANLRIDTLIGGHVYGVIETDTQPNIKVMQNLTDTTTSNANITVGNISTLTAGGLLYPTVDGPTPNPNEIVALRTDGDATLSFEVIHTDRIANATSSVFVNLDGSTDVTANGVLSFSVIETGAEVTGALTVSGNIDSDTLNVTTAVVTPKVEIGSTAIYSATSTTTSIASATLVGVDVTGCRAIEFFVKGEDAASGKYTVATITAIHNGTSVVSTVNKLNFDDGAQAGSFSVEFADNAVQLKVTPTGTASTVWTTQFRTI